MVRGAEMRIAETRAVNRALPGWLRSFPVWLACLAWRPQAIGVLPHLCQGALEKELDSLIRRAVFPFREFPDPRFQAGWYSDKQFCERRSLGLFLGFRPPRARRFLGDFPPFFGGKRCGSGFASFLRTQLGQSNGVGIFLLFVHGS